MEHAPDDPWLAGVDGCVDGWLAAFVQRSGDEVRLRVLRDFAGVLTAPEAPAVVLVDMPIGLPQQSELRGRAPERTVRAVIGARRSSVFRIPSRSAVYASVDPDIPDDRERFLRACAIARSTSPDRKAFAKQGFYLCKKIVQLDQLLRADTLLIERVFETHPEVAFWRLNGQREVPEPKKRKGRLHAPGLEFREQLLIDFGLPPKIVRSDAPKGAGRDDLLDALVCAVIARRKYAGLARSFPDAPPRDAFGLPMAIWA